MSKHFETSAIYLWDKTDRLVQTKRHCFSSGLLVGNCSGSHDGITRQGGQSHGQSTGVSHRLCVSSTDSQSIGSKYKSKTKSDELHCGGSWCCGYDLLINHDHYRVVMEF